MTQIQCIQTAHTNKYQKTSNQIKTWTEDLSRYFFKKDNTQMIIRQMKVAQHR